MARRKSDNINDGTWYKVSPEKWEDLCRAMENMIHPEHILRQNSYPRGVSNLPAPINYPPEFTGEKKRRAVVFDCEMVGIAPNNTSHICQLCVVDVLTGEIIINSVIDPIPKVTDWRTQYSGMSAREMGYMRKSAPQDGRFLRGFEAARNAFFNVVDQNTIFVTHAGQNDLRALGLVHDRVIDTQIITTSRVRQLYPEGNVNPYSLKDITRDFLGRWIQGGNGHNCLEDAFVTRDNFLRIWRHPEYLQEWGEDKASSLREPEKQSHKKKPAKSKSPSLEPSEFL